MKGREGKENIFLIIFKLYSYIYTWNFHVFIQEPFYHKYQNSWKSSFHEDEDIVHITVNIYPELLNLVQSRAV